MGVFGSSTMLVLSASVMLPVAAAMIFPEAVALYVRVEAISTLIGNVLMVSMKERSLSILPMLYCFDDSRGIPIELLSFNRKEDTSIRFIPLLDRKSVV